MISTEISLLPTASRHIGTPIWSLHPRVVKLDSTEYSIDESIEAAGLNFTVHKEQLKLADGRPTKSFAVLRDDTGEILSDYVGPEWTASQNRDKFLWFQKYLDDKSAKLTHAGCLPNGKMIIIAKFNHPDDEVMPGDNLERDVLITDFFGKRALQLSLINLRAICANGRIFTSKKFGSMNIRHSSQIHNRLEDAHENILAWDEAFSENLAQYKFLASKDIKSENSLVEFFAASLKMEKGEDGFGTRQQNTLERLKSLFNDPVHNKGTSMWSAYNAITAYTNHYTGRSIETAMDSLFYGANNTIQERALSLALETANTM